MKHAFVLFTALITLVLTACNHTPKPNKALSDAPLHAFMVPTPPAAMDPKKVINRQGLIKSLC